MTYYAKRQWTKDHTSCMVSDVLQCPSTGHLWRNWCFGGEQQCRTSRQDVCSAVEASQKFPAIRPHLIYELVSQKPCTLNPATPISYQTEPEALKLLFSQTLPAQTTPRQRKVSHRNLPDAGIAVRIPLLLVALALHLEVFYESEVPHSRDQCSSSVSDLKVTVFEVRV